MRGAADWIRVYFTGVAMGIADLVPGVSGGTVAFVAGIYDELLGTVAGLNFSLLGVARREGLAAAWRQSNAAFLVVLLAGILSSVAAFAGLLHRLLEEEPVKLWAFFFGLVAASVPLVGREIKRWNAQRLVWALIGLATAGLVTSLPPLVQSDAPIFLFASGAVAICAMILPGISGSFLLLILGAYAAVIGALKGFDVLRIGAFGAGAALGLVGFSRVLKRLLERHRAATLSVLTGFLLGSLNALWPWKEAVRALYTHSDGRVEYFRVNAAPPADALDGAVWMALGAALVIGLDAAARRLKRA